MPTEVVEKNPREVQVSFYSDFYRKNKSDSPDASRTSLLRRSVPHMSGLGGEDYVLELGSGRQILTREYLRDRQAQPSFTVVTLDIAEITRKQLLAGESLSVSHIRADGGRLPFQSGKFALVVSSMALDFMGEEAIPEVHRVLKPGGRAEINLHHPNLIPKDLDQLLVRRKIPKAERTVLEYWLYLREQEVLTSDPELLRGRFVKNGLAVEKLVEAHDSHDTWWEVSLRKDQDICNPATLSYHPEMTRGEVIRILQGGKIGFFRDWGNV